jgi:hypothetical protein
VHSSSKIVFKPNLAHAADKVADGLAMTGLDICYALSELDQPDVE